MSRQRLPDRAGARYGATSPQPAIVFLFDAGQRLQLMRMEFSRLTGVFVSQRPCSSKGRSIAELCEEAANALASYYESDDYTFWPKKEYASNPTEQVQIIDSKGAVIFEYDLIDLLKNLRCLSPGDPDGAAQVARPGPH
jgi:hypothetical protein